MIEHTNRKVNMQRIIWNTEVNAPCCAGEIINCDNEEESVLIQSDYDWPSIATTFGWSTREVQRNDSTKCDHSETDGTVDCKLCGVTASEFIAAAGEWLRDHDGCTADDPGYFA